MSGHPRKLIRDTVKDILIDKTLVGRSVFLNRKIHPDSDCLPCIVIHTESETVELLNQAPKKYQRTLSIVIEIFAKGITEIECQDKLDQIAWQIENLLADDDDWHETVNHTDLASVRFQFQETGTNPIGACIMTYEAEYLTSLPVLETQVSAELTDLQQIQGDAPNFGWDIVTQEGDPDGAIDAELLVVTEV